MAKDKTEIVDLDAEGGTATAADTMKDADGAALTKKEKAEHANTVGKEQMKELDTLYELVLVMKAAIDSGAFKQAYFVPIDFAINTLRTQLETEEKPREVTFSQGKLAAYKAMKDFPMTCVEQFNVKLEAIKRTIPLFVKDDQFVQKIKVTYDKVKHEILITTPTPAETKKPKS